MQSVRFTVAPMMKQTNNKPKDRKASLLLFAYLVATHILRLWAPLHLRRRRARGKEDPARWREKMGYPSVERPQGRLIWMHAVGLGEVLALRGLIEAFSRLDATLSFLVTSSSRASAEVFGANMPARTVHQFLPLDVPIYLERFLTHWSPELSIWVEQEIWPGAAVAAHRKGVPLAWVNARISAQGYHKRMRMAGLYKSLLSRFALVTAQDQASAERITAFCGRTVEVMPSLKVDAIPLSSNKTEFSHLTKVLNGRRVWVLASSHPGDEIEAIAAQAALRDRLLILVPRDPSRAAEIEAALHKENLPFVRRSLQQTPGAEHQVWLADTFGELGLWYRLAEAALIGGGFDQIGGHNPWEAAVLGVPILYGPDVQNFSEDYAELSRQNAALRVEKGMLAQALEERGLEDMAQNASRLVVQNRHKADVLTSRLLDLANGQGE